MKNRKIAGMNTVQVIILFVLGIAVCLIIVTGGVMLTAEYFSNIALVNNPTASPTKPPTRTSPPPQPTQRFPDNIPGLTYNSIVSFLDQARMVCEPMTKDDVGFSASCVSPTNSDALSVYVDIYSGEQPSDIYLIQAFVIQMTNQPLDEYAVQILRAIALIPYENSNPYLAGLWVQEKLLTVTESTPAADFPVTKIGGVLYHLTCQEKTIRCLSIGQGSGSPNPSSVEEMTTGSNNPTSSFATSTPIPIIATKTPLSAIDPFVVNNWQLFVQKVEILSSTEFQGETSYPVGRFAAFFLSITNVGNSTETFIGTITILDLMDADFHRFAEDIVASFHVQLMYGFQGTEGVNIDPGETRTIIVVYDISLQSEAYYFVQGPLADAEFELVLVEIP